MERLVNINTAVIRVYDECQVQNLPNFSLQTTDLSSLPIFLGSLMETVMRRPGPRAGLIVGGATGGGHLPFAQFFVIFLSLQSLGRALFNLPADARRQVFELGTFDGWWLRCLGYN